MPKYLLSLILSICIFMQASGQTNRSNADELYLPDSSRQDKFNNANSYLDSDSLFTIAATPYFKEKEMHKDSINKWRQQDQYTKAVQLDSLLRAIQATDLKNVQRGTEGVSLFTRFMNSNLLKTLLWIIAAGFVLFILYQLIVSKGLFLSSRKQEENISAVEDEQHMEWNNLDALLRDAVQGKKYRLATRYLFLNTLKTLGDKGLVNIEREKTNVAYRNELPEVLKPGFRNVSNLFEKTWYGNVEPNEDQFRMIEKQFAQLKSEIK